MSAERTVGANKGISVEGRVGERAVTFRTAQGNCRPAAALI